MAACCPPSSAPLLDLARVDGSRGRGRDHGRRPRRLDRPRRLRPRLCDRGVGKPRDRLALHRPAAPFGARRATAQKLVAIQFFLLAPFVTFEALHDLVAGERAETSWLGIALVTTSLVGMPMLGIAKRRLADELGSVATRGEGTQNLLCAYLAAAVLVGLLGNTLFGLWWLDPVAALVVAAVALREGVQTLARRGLRRLLLTRAAREEAQRRREARRGEAGREPRSPARAGTSRPRFARESSEPVRGTRRRRPE